MALIIIKGASPKNVIEVLIDAAGAKRGINQVLLEEAESKAVVVAAHPAERRDGCSIKGIAGMEPGFCGGKAKVVEVEKTGVSTVVSEIIIEGVAGDR